MPVRAELDQRITTRTEEIDIGRRGWPVSLKKSVPGNAAGALSADDAETLSGAFLAFLLGLGAALYVRVIGYLAMTDIYVLCATPLLLPSLLRKSTTVPLRWLLPLAWVWMASTVITDLINFTQLELAARGFSRVVIYIVGMMYFSHFLASNRVTKLIAFHIGLVPSTLIGGFYFRAGHFEQMGYQAGAVTESMDWRLHWNSVMGTLGLVIVLLLYRRARAMSYAITFVEGFIHMVMGSRSQGANKIMGGLICFCRNAITQYRASGRRISVPASGLLLVAISLMAAGLYFGYEYLARERHLGELQYQRYQDQAKNKFGVFGAARAEFIGGCLAVGRSPIIGYGSWPLDHYGIFEEMCELLEIKPTQTTMLRGYRKIPSHSQLLQAWVENGIGGAIFWLYVLWSLGVQIVRPMKNERSLRLWASIVVVNFAWSILFSPIANKISQAMVLAALFHEMWDADRPTTIAAPTAMSGR